MCVCTRSTWLIRTHLPPLRGQGVNPIVAGGRGDESGPRLTVLYCAKTCLGTTSCSRAIFPEFFFSRHLGGTQTLNLAWLERQRYVEVRYLAISLGAGVLFSGRELSVGETRATTRKIMENASAERKPPLESIFARNSHELYSSHCTVLWTCRYLHLF